MLAAHGSGRRKIRRVGADLKRCDGKRRHQKSGPHAETINCFHSAPPSRTGFARRPRRCHDIMRQNPGTANMRRR